MTFDNFPLADVLRTSRTLIMFPRPPQAENMFRTLSLVLGRVRLSGRVSGAKNWTPDAAHSVASVFRILRSLQHGEDDPQKLQYHITRLQRGGVTVRFEAEAEPSFSTRTTSSNFYRGGGATGATTLKKQKEYLVSDILKYAFASIVRTTAPNSGGSAVGGGGRQWASQAEDLRKRFGGGWSPFATRTSSSSCGPSKKRTPLGDNLVVVRSGGIKVGQGSPAVSTAEQCAQELLIVSENDHPVEDVLVDLARCLDASLLHATFRETELAAAFLEGGPAPTEDGALPLLETHFPAQQILQIREYVNLFGTPTASASTSVHCAPDHANVDHSPSFLHFLEQGHYTDSISPVASVGETVLVDEEGERFAGSSKAMVVPQAVVVSSSETPGSSVSGGAAPAPGEKVRPAHTLHISAKLLDFTAAHNNDPRNNNSRAVVTKSANLALLLSAARLREHAVETLRTAESKIAPGSSFAVLAMLGADSMGTQWKEGVAVLAKKIESLEHARGELSLLAGRGGRGLVTDVYVDELLYPGRREQGRYEQHFQPISKTFPNVLITLWEVVIRSVCVVISTVLS